MSKRTPIEIVTSTTKAHLVKDAEGRQGWVQNRSLKDGSVVAATFEKAVKNFAEREAGKKIRAEREAADLIFRDSFHMVKITAQTDAAIGVEVVVEDWRGIDDKKTVWFPKSQCGPGEAQGTAFVPGWMIRDRESKVTGAAGADYYSRHRTAKGAGSVLLSGVAVLATSIAA